MAWPLGYTLLPGLPGGTGAWAYGVSGDGLVAVGEADVNGTTIAYPVYWTQLTGPIDLGSLAPRDQPGGADAFAQAASQDGSVIVGTAVGTDTNYHAFRWTSGGGMLALPEPMGATAAQAYGISDDGTVIVGEFDDSLGFSHACYWLNSAAPVDIGTLPDGTYARAYAASNDGSVIVGVSQTTGGVQHAFRWTQAGGMVDLDPGGPTNSAAMAVSSDGAVVVGSIVAGNNHAFRWTAGGGLVNLGTLPGGSLSLARGVNGDSSLVVGTGDNSAGTQVPWTWTLVDGMVALPDAPGISLTASGDAYAVSVDSSVIVGDAPILGPDTPGNGQNPALYSAHWNGTGFDPPFVQSPNMSVFASQLVTGVGSFWLHNSPLHSSASAFNVSVTDEAVDPAMYYAVTFGFDINANFYLDVIRQNGPGTNVQYQAGAVHGAAPLPPECAVHVLFSFDFTAGAPRFQLYVNDVAWTVDALAGDLLAPPTFGATTHIQEAIGNFVTTGSGYIADLWFGSRPGFVDLTTTANRRKFINSDLSPVDLGANGQIPFSAAPQLYQTIPDGGVVGDWLANKGTAGGTFAVTYGTVTSVGNPCAAPGSAVYTAWVYGRVAPPPPDLITVHRATCMRGRRVILTHNNISGGTVSDQFRVLTMPAHGTLKHGNQILGVNDTFTQAQVDSGDLAYTENGDNVILDGFTFAVEAVA